MSLKRVTLIAAIATAAQTVSVAYGTVEYIQHLEDNSAPTLGSAIRMLLAVIQPLTVAVFLFALHKRQQA